MISFCSLCLRLIGLRAVLEVSVSKSFLEASKGEEGQERLERETE
jgi:hypothetical protein